MKKILLNELHHDLPVFILLSVVLSLGIWQISSGKVAQGAAAPRVAAACATTVNTDISTNTTWAPANSPVCLTGSVTVGPAATLTIQPGVTVYASSGVTLVVQGALSALGTSGSPILFTSDLDSGPGQWQGLYIDGTQGIGHGALDYVTVRDAGESYLGQSFNLRVEGGGALSLTHSTIASSSGYGAYLNGISSLTFTTNTLQNNGSYPLVVPFNQVNNVATNSLSGNHPDRVLLGKTGPSDLPASADWRLDNGSGAYELASSLTVDPAATLSVQPGVTVLMDTLVNVDVQGQLFAAGTSGAPILFTSDLDSGPGQWQGVVLDGYQAAGHGTLSYVTVRDGGQSYLGTSAELRVVGGGSLAMTNSTIANSMGYGVYVDNNSSSLTFTHNTVQNNGLQGMYVPVATLSNILNNTLTGNTPNRILISGSSLGVQ